jgi:DNA-binding CsgD family transcriptional regulator/predicted SnoaL-like aldol condensation-catalyzing enzyme
MFSKDEAEQFIRNLWQTYLTEGKVELIEQFYDKDIICHHGADTYYFEDIRNRGLAIKNNTKNIHTRIIDFCVIYDLIIVKLKQSWLDRKTEQFIETPATNIYRIKNEKICEAWFLISDKLPSYREINTNFSNATKNFEVNQKEKWEFLARLALVEKAAPSGKKELTQVERECLFYYIHGFSAKETAAQMHLTFRTVQTYIAGLKERFGCANKLALRKNIFAQLANI